MQENEKKKDLTLRHQAMSNAMFRVANKYKNEEMLKVAEELKELSKKPEEKQMTPDPKVPWSKVSKVLLNYGKEKAFLLKTPEFKKTAQDEHEKVAPSRKQLYGR